MGERGGGEKEEEKDQWDAGRDVETRRVGHGVKGVKGQRRIFDVK